MRNRASIIVCAIAVVVLVSGWSPTHKTVISSTCGIPYTFHVGKKTVRSGSCAGQLAPVAPRITVRLHARFSVEIGHNVNGSLDFPVPKPGGAPVVLTKRRGSDAIYVAKALGTTELIAHRTRFCLATNPKIGSCPALEVTVAASEDTRHPSPHDK